LFAQRRMKSLNPSVSVAHNNCRTAERIVMKFCLVEFD
jgi:hypothetical protein